MLPAIISKLGLPVLINLIGSALGQINNPVAQSASKSLENFQGVLASGAITAEQMIEANRHVEEMARLNTKEYESALTQVNETIRKESSSEDLYVRRMRPTFGYLMAVTWAAQMLGLAYVMIFQTEKAPAVLDGMQSLSTIWAVGLSVLGIYVYKRSEEKRAFSGASVLKAKPDPVPVEKTTNISPRKSALPSLNQ